MSYPVATQIDSSPLSKGLSQIKNKKRKQQISNCKTNPSKLSELLPHGEGGKCKYGTHAIVAELEAALPALRTLAGGGHRVPSPPAEVTFCVCQSCCSAC